MRFETRKLADLRPAEYNPRKPLTPSDPEYQELKRSILELGYADPIVINYDGTIIKGHQRRTVMMDLGMEEAGVVVLDIRDKSKEKLANIALNKLTGRWDEEALKNVLQELDLEGYDFTVTGFKQDDLSDLIQALDIPAEANDDDFDPDEVAAGIETPTTKRGAIWQLGRHRLMCGDATNPADVAKLMGGNLLDLVITDPPYNVAYGDKCNDAPGYFKNAKRGDNDYIQNDTMSQSDFYKFLYSAYQNIAGAMRPGAAIYTFHADRTAPPFYKAYAETGLKIHQIIIWEKSGFVLSRQDYQQRHEPILYGWKKGAAHYFIKDRTQDTIFLEDPPDFKAMKKQELLAFIDGLFREYQDQTTVLFEKKPGRNTLHPTMKPVPLMGRLINNSSRPGWNVGDFFAGSGSTVIAAEQLGRTAYALELDERYCDVIVKRWEKYTGDVGVLLNG